MLNFDILRSPMNWLFVGFALILLSFISQIFLKEKANG